MNFGEVLTRAWHIIWKNKILWLFGFFASLGAGGGGNGGANFNYNFGGGNFPGSTEQMPAWMERLIETAPIWVPILVLLGLVFIAVLVVLNTLGRIGLARGAWLADQSATGGQVFPTLNFGILWEAGRRYFWRVLLLIILLWALTITLGFIILVPIIGLSILTLGIGLICLLPLLCVLFIAFWAMTVIADLAVIGIVNEDRTLTDAIRRAWVMFKARPADIFITAFILWVGSLVVGLVVGLPVLLILMPIIGSAIFNSEEMLQGSLILSGILFLLYLPVLLFVQSVLQAYINTAWTLVYRRLGALMQNISQAQVIDVPANPES